MKKFIKILIVCFSLIPLVSCNKLPSNVEEIEYDEFKQKIENKESFIIYFGHSSCSGCKIIKDNLNELSKEGKELSTWYYVDVNNLSEDIIDNEFVDFAETLIDPLDYMSEGYVYGRPYTPTIFKFINGNLVYASIGSKDKYYLGLLDSYSMIQLGYYHNIEQVVKNNDIYFYDDKNEESKAEFNRIFQENKNSNEISYFIQLDKLNAIEYNQVLEKYNSNLEEKVTEISGVIKLAYNTID